MELSEIKSVYFVGIGGIGMSAIARYFLSKKINVAGYDRTPSLLTGELEDEGASVHYSDDPNEIPEDFRNPADTLVVYTPAIPDDNAELNFFRKGGFELQKRAQLLGTITRAYKGLCVAGTHGKTTTSAMTAHILHESKTGCNAFLGGISKNYDTNLLLSDKSEYVVIEADEFDRSFHHLTPYATVITSTDPDHLDVYGTVEAYRKSFEHYTSLIAPGGYTIMHVGADITHRTETGVHFLTYGRDEGDFHAERIRIGDGRIVFDLISPFGNIVDIELGVPISINIDNGIAAMALAQIAGVSSEDIRKAMRSFEGVVRRFDFKVKKDNLVIISDYAHHPEEIHQSIASIREVFGGREITGIFQPHLYSRTQDFYKEFAESLSALDRVILLDIYPAREKPIEGVTSKLIFDELPDSMDKELCRKEELIDVLRQNAAHIDVLMVIGAGDIDDYMPQIEGVLMARRP